MAEPCPGRATAQSVSEQEERGGQPRYTHGFQAHPSGPAVLGRRRHRDHADGRSASVDDGGYTRIDTSAAQQLITEKKVERPVVTNNEVVDLDLKKGETYSDGKNVKDATKVRTAVRRRGRGPSFVKLLEDNAPPGRLHDQVDKDTNPLLRAAGSASADHHPARPVLVPHDPDAGRRLARHAVRQVQGQARHQGHPEGHLRRRRRVPTRRSRSSTRSRSSSPEPAKFLAVGAKIPKGVLLYGPPGTGKTLLARAVAGEAGVPFYSISGSDFVEMFVGVGASRVRDLFEQAKANAPAIVFVDEIDAVGRHRGAGLGGGHDEREQTLNQLLVEMDGFDVKTNVILIAATNRPDILDPALLRPGRFDRQIAVEAPDMIGRHRILEVHSQGKPMATGVDLLAVARRTPGFTGADLANVLNEAALLTARSDGKLIDDAALDEAIDRVIAGPQKRTRIMSAKERKITAYHEGGHAIVAAAMNHLDPVTKVTILPRGRALGYTMVMPTDDKYSTTRNEILDQLVLRAWAAGSRRRSSSTTPPPGASNDIEKATGDGPQDGHRVRHERAGRRDQAGPVAGRGLPRPRHGPPARLLRGGRRHRRRGGPQAHRRRARRGVARHQRQPRHPRQAGPRPARARDPQRQGARGHLRRRSASGRCARPGCPARPGSCPTSRRC